MAKSKRAPAAKKVAKKPAAPRRLQQPTYRSFRLHKRIKPVQPPITGSFRLLSRTLVTLKRNGKLFLGLTIVYGVLTLLFVRGFSAAVDTAKIQDTASQIFSGKWAGLLTAGVLFSSVAGSSNAAAQTSTSGYQPILVIMMTLTYVWSLRQIFAKQRLKIKDAFYEGIRPFVPFLLVLGVIALQLVPLTIGTWLYGIVISQFIAVTMLEKVLWFMLFALLGLLSIYMVSSSIFALFIVALPQMTPMKALRSARKLVLHRRWVVMRKVLFLPVVMLLMLGAIMLPFLLWLPGLAEAVYFILTIVGLPFAVTYIYGLYRELLNE